MVPSEQGAASSTGGTTRRKRSPRLHRDPRRAALLPLPHIDHGLDVLGQLDRFLCLTNRQISDLLFADRPNRDGVVRTERAATAAASRTLQRLWHAGYVERLPLFLTSRRTGTPYPHFVNVLSPQGADALGAYRAAQAQPEPLRWTKAALEVGLQQLGHTVALNGRAALVRRAARRRGLAFGSWYDDRQLAGLTRAGTTRFRAVPDGFFLLHDTTARAAYFLELDLGTETVFGLAPERRDWAGKIAGYVQYFAQEYPRETFFRGLAAPVVLTVTISEERQANLLAATREAGGGAGYWFTTLDALDPEESAATPRAAAVFAPIWRVPTDARRRALLGEPG